MKYLVKVNSLKFEDGTFSRGDVIEVSEERASHFDINDIQLIPESIIAIIEAPKTDVEQPTVEASVIEAPSMAVSNVKRVRKPVK